MPWVRVDDAFYDHRKTSRAGPLAEFLWYRALQWSNRNLTDGFIPAEQLRRLADFCFDVGELTDDYDPDRPEAHLVSGFELAARLVAAGLWITVEGDSPGWTFHDYSCYQLLAHEIREQREELSRKRSEAGRKGAARRWQDGNQHGNVIANEQQTVWQTDSKTMAPTPTPTPTDLHPPTTESRWPVDNRGEEIIKILVATERTQTSQVRNGTAWTKTVTERIAAEHGARIAQLLERYPGAPDTVIAGAVRGETANLRYYATEGTEQ